MDRHDGFNALKNKALSRLKIAVCLVVTLLCTWFLSASAEDPTPPSAQIKDLMTLSNYGVIHRPFTNERGQSINITIFNPEANGKNANPIVIIPGVAESFLRYALLAEHLKQNGYGPIYLLGHIGQNGSTELNPKKAEVLYIDSFRNYVQDLSYFLQGPLREDLSSRGITQKPPVIAHSMGGAILNLALLDNPFLVDRVVYIAPMFRIKISKNEIVDRLARVAIDTLCFAKCGFLSAKIPQPTKESLGKAQYSFDEWAMQMERVTKMSNTAISLKWMQEAISATVEIRRRAHENKIPSLVIVAENDKLINNSVFEEYACSAKGCKFLKIRGGHSLHVSHSSAVRAELFSSIVFYLGNTPADSLPTKYEARSCKYFLQ